MAPSGLYARLCHAFLVSINLRAAEIVNYYVIGVELAFAHPVKHFKTQIHSLLQ